jgi:hypothetical protein
VETPEGTLQRTELDTIFRVSRLGYAMSELTPRARPVVRQLLKEYFG